MDIIKSHRIIRICQNRFLLSTHPALLPAPGD